MRTEGLDLGCFSSQRNFLAEKFYRKPWIPGRLDALELVVLTNS